MTTGRVRHASPPGPSRAEQADSQCACLHARMTARAVTRMYDEALRASGLKVTQFSLLAALEHGPTRSVSALAGMLALERTTLTRNLRLLGDAGLIAQRPGPRRAVSHTLTQAGHDALARARPLWRAAQRAVIDSLGEQGWRDARDKLRALRDAAQESS